MMNIVNRNPKELIPYPGNAKKHSKQQIGKVALSQPVVIDAQGVIAGHAFSS